MLPIRTDSGKKQDTFREAVSPILARTVSFPAQSHPHSLAQGRQFSTYRDHGSYGPPRDADDDDSGDDEELVEDEDEDGRRDSSDDDREEETPLLPIFSATHLDSLPVFSLTHTVRLLVVEKCDTVLTWDQLRSPQVSQFLVKPIQQQIKDSYLNAATQYALLANALQFTKEANSSPGSSGTNRTRAMLCELLAIRLLREYTARELIDALSYDFDPLQGQPEQDRLPSNNRTLKSVRPTRISCIEIALRAQAKKFLAHPLVVQHLEAIWNGVIVFHSAADSMHRKRQTFVRSTSYGTNALPSTSLAVAAVRWNKTVTLYDPRDASLLKLSRLRVPRYRNVLSTLSFAVLLCLFLAVLQERSTEITTLEIIFWIWAAGYMLDEVIGFTDQGFSLYIASFWNTFDLGILFLLFVHLCLRLDGLFMPDTRSKVQIAGYAYDVLAVTAILLFPRLFSVLDHYRYFSQLIIAFRMMAADMLAIFVLIVIFCSGFLVSLTLAFGRNGVDDPRAVAYALLQMLLGFTPAAWDRWDDYNWLGKAVLTLFLFVCHFVVVTILITVLTNSFMDVVRNANEEHQYLFAVNTISNVKSDALFAYIPPVNVVQWLLTPLRYVVPFREYVKINRTIIKITHFPILLTIYLYERFVLRPNVVDTTDLVESRGRVGRSFADRLPRMMREPSIATFRQEAALEEVFRHPADATLRTAVSQEHRRTSNVISSWMQSMGDENNPPQRQNRRTIERLERRKLGMRRLGSSQRRDFSYRRRPTSVASDPNDLTSFADLFSPKAYTHERVEVTPSAVELPSQQTDADGDDELMTSDNNTAGKRRSGATLHGPQTAQNDYFSRRLSPPSKVRAATYRAEGLEQVEDDSKMLSGTAGRHLRPHMRNVSSATMIYHPPEKSDSSSRSSQKILIRPTSKVTSLDGPVGTHTPSSKPSTNTTARKTAKRTTQSSKDHATSRSTPNVSEIYQPTSEPVIITKSPHKRRISPRIDLMSDIGDNKAIGGGYVGALPASFASQMAHATHAVRQSQRQLQEQQRQDEADRRKDDTELLSRLMMARMNTLEEGFREVVHEVRESMKKGGSNTTAAAVGTNTGRQRSLERPDRGADKIGRKKRDNKAVVAAASTELDSGNGGTTTSTIDAEQENSHHSLAGAAAATEQA